MLPAHLAGVDDEVAVLAAPDDEAVLADAVQGAVLGHEIQLGPGAGALLVVRERPVQDVQRVAGRAVRGAGVHLAEGGQVVEIALAHDRGADGGGDGLDRAGGPAGRGPGGDRGRHPVVERRLRRDRGLPAPGHLQEPVQPGEHEQGLVDEPVPLAPHLPRHLLEGFPEVVGDGHLANGDVAGLVAHGAHAAGDYHGQKWTPMSYAVVGAL